MENGHRSGSSALGAPPSRFRRAPFRCLALLVVGAGLGYGAAGANEVAAQELWTEASTLGYTALGVGVAFAAISGGDCSGCALGAAVGLVAGGLGFGVGNFIGSSAESTARSGEKPSARQLWGVRIGTVLAGASLGAVVGGIYVNRKFVKNPGEDERDVVILSVLGAAVGAWVEYGQEAWLRGASTDLTPMVRRTPEGATELGVTLSTRR